MFESRRYQVVRIDGDYAFLSLAEGSAEEIQVARALLPEDIDEGCLLIWENLQYRMSEE